MVEQVIAPRASSSSVRDSARANTLSPVKSNKGAWDGDFRRPASPASKKGGRSMERRPTAILTTAPTSILRTHSANASQAAHGANGSPKTSDTDALQLTVTVDPVTQQIYDRTGDTPIIRQNSGDTSFTLDESERPGKAQGPGHLARIDTGASSRQPKSNHKGVSFLSRIIGGGNKKDNEQSDHGRDDTSMTEGRPEGKDATIFSPVSDAAEHHHPHVHLPGYIRVRARHTRRRHFDALVLAQELAAEPHPAHNVVRRKSMMPADTATVWAAEFSKDGKYLATAGQDKVVRVWAVLTTPEERQAETRRNTIVSPGPSPQSEHTAQVFKSRPVREYKGHTAAVLDLSWSKNNFLLSSSMDKTVRLWHVTRPDVLCTFKHADFVSAVAFHPGDDRLFLTGSLDRKLRLWSVADKHVAFWIQEPEMITAVAFTPDGKTTLSGSCDGLLQFHETEGLRYQTQTRIKSVHSKHTKGSKITGIQTFQHPHGAVNGDTKVLITSNDSRIRLYNFRDKALEVKLKGVENGSAQIRASVSDDQRYICSGSEDHRAYIWPMQSQNDEDPAKRRLEHFQAHESAVTCVRMAPVKTRILLSKSADPIYDLCEPPTARAPQDRRSSSQSSSRPPTEPGEGLGAEHELKRMESPSGHPGNWTHPDGNIIVTTSSTGAIKVFRQDCAADNRHPRSAHKRLSTMSFQSRAGSLRTKSSNQSLYAGRPSTSTQAPSDRIISWRQSVGTTASSTRNASISSRQSARSVSPSKSARSLRAVSGPAVTGRLSGTRTPTDSVVSSSVNTPTHSNQTSPHLTSDLVMTRISPPAGASKPTTPTPSRAMDQTTPTQALSDSALRRSSSASLNKLVPDDMISPTTIPPPARSITSTTATKKTDRPESARKPHHAPPATDAPDPATPATAIELEPNPLMLQGEQSNLFWNVERVRLIAQRAKRNFREAQAERERARLEEEAEAWHDAFESQDSPGSLLSPGDAVGGGGGGGAHRPNVLGTRGRDESFVSRLSIERSASGGSRSPSIGASDRSATGPSSEEEHRGRTH